MFKKLKSDKRGVTLFELLIAIAILAVVVSPLLGSLVSSARLNKRTREMSAQTAVGQSLLEKAVALPMASVLGGSLGQTGFFTLEDGAYSPADADSIALGQDEYYLGFSRIKGQDGEEYDALLTLKATPNTLNQTEITRYSPMDAVFSQGGGGGDQNPDVLAAQVLAGEAALITGDETFDTVGMFRHGFDRIIDIYVKEKAGGEIACSVAFSYSATITVGDINSSEITRHTLEYNIPESEFFSGKAGDFSSMYFFYYPNYDYYSSLNVYDYYSSLNVSDVINIHNNIGGGNVNFSLFLIKQKAFGLVKELFTDVDESAVEALIEDLDNKYNAEVNLFENGGISDKTAGIYSNLCTNIISGGGTVQDPTYGKYAGMWGSRVAFVNQLVRLEKQTRIYSAEVTVLPAGTVNNGGFAPAPSSEILTFGGLKTN